jgi:hypothetical protein
MPGVFLFERVRDVEERRNRIEKIIILNKAILMRVISWLGR